MNDEGMEIIPASTEYRQTKDLAAEARRRGIDPTKQGWMARLVLEITKDKKQEVTA